MIFFCRNNGYAISTPAEDQYAGDGIISRAPGYGMAGIRVDGNDVFAVHAAVAEARKLALETSAPVMIEAMTYRQGHHSTSDDSSRYRDVDEVQAAQDVTDPLIRMDKFLSHYGWMDNNAVTSIGDEERAAVLRAMEAAEARPTPTLESMFTDVYHEKPPHLIRQEKELRQHLRACRRCIQSKTLRCSPPPNKSNFSKILDLLIVPMIMVPTYAFGDEWILNEYWILDTGY
eukprot:scaffold5759_cov135-Skeletonema_menzelii.AAC.2